MRAVAAIVATGLLLALAACGGAEPDKAGAGPASPEQALGGSADAGFARATHPRGFRFPFDHGAHPAYRNEWWYVTGNLTDTQDRRYGFQLTLFRIGLAPGHARRPSAWATHELWMGHLALTDVHGRHFQAHQRFARGGHIGLAGARRDPVRVWLENWRLSRNEDGTWQLQASADGMSLELALDPRGPPVLQGDHGLSRKSAAPGNASYYYSIPRLSVRGHLTRSGQRRAVSGSAWLDREWSTSALGPHERGWDWFALQLDDGTNVMLYRLRRDDGSTSRFSAGTVMYPDGRVRHLHADDFRIDVTDHWTSPRGGTYPAGWRLHIAGVKPVLRVHPVLPDQELDLAVRYWEGAVNVDAPEGRTGVGYVELTGYAGRGVPGSGDGSPSR